MTELYVLALLLLTTITRVKLEEGSGLGGAYTGWVHLPGTTTRRSLPASRRRRSASAATPRPWWSSASAAPIWAPARWWSCSTPQFQPDPQGRARHLLCRQRPLLHAMLEVIELVKDKDFSINVISKSGTTTEPAVAFRIFKALLEKYGKEGPAGASTPPPAPTRGLEGPGRRGGL